MSKEWLDAAGRFLFGKHQGELAERVAREDPRYLSWVLEDVEDLGENEREILEALKERTRR
jgi:hypothetical protein